ncbi:MAG: HAMP domain-containing histidine kinase, partial [Clostridia bacterium]|nr:HAMP domain-containing histidine kinase [Clostridia bacterium]
MTERKTHSKLGVVLIVCTVLSFLLSVLAFFGITHALNNILTHVVYKREAIIEAEKAQLNDLIEYLNRNRASITSEDAIRSWIKGKKDLMLAVYDPVNPYAQNGNQATLYSSVKDALSMYNLLQDEYSEYWYSSAVASRGDRIRSRVVKVMYFPMYRASQYGLYASGAIAFLLFVFVLYACIRKKTKYIFLLSRELQAMESGDLSSPVTIRGNDEITSLALDMDKMRVSFIERLAKEEEMTRRASELLTAMSHDLRTPLTSLIGYLDIVELGKCGSDEQMKKYIRSGREKAYQIKEMTDRLFEYFLVYQPSDEPFETEIMDAGMLFSQLWLESALILETDGYIIKVTGPEREMPIRANAPFLRRVIDNIVSNIRKYADISEPVLVSLKEENGLFVFQTMNAVLEKKGNAESSGIGLKSCEKILKSHAGAFSYEEKNEVYTTRLT